MAHPHALRAWKKLPVTDVPLYRRALTKLALGAENIRVMAMGHEETRARQRFGISGNLFAARATRDRRIMLTYDDGGVLLLDFVARNDRTYYKRER